LRRTGWVQCVTYGFGLAGDPGEHARAVLEDVGGGDGVQRDVGAQVQRRHPARALHCTALAPAPAARSALVFAGAALVDRTYAERVDDERRRERGR
jgi:hypothetical protein